MIKMSSVMIREIRPEDYYDICLLNKELGYDYPLEKVKVRIEHIQKNTKDIIFVAQRENEVIGYIHGSPYELLYSDSLINILGFVVKERYRSKGVGSLLIQHSKIGQKKTDSAESVWYPELTGRMPIDFTVSTVICIKKIKRIL
jgi:predicted N-acetyltransferase YhbS